MQRIPGILRAGVVCLVVIASGWASSTASAQWLPTYVRGNFTLGNESTAAQPYDLADTFFLESNPGATKTIYLDFDGHHSFNNRWNHDIVFDSFDRNSDVTAFSNSELREIQDQFQNVVEDFLPFDVNVTTFDPGYDALVRSSAGDQTYGVRVLNTQNVAGSNAGGGGTAYLNSFNAVDDRDTVAFTFNKGGNNGGMTNSHEIGHTLGLRHDGLDGATYHPGTGSGNTSWGPLMGAPFNDNLTQWSIGDYDGSSTNEDDLAIITKAANGINYRVDLVGDSIGEALEIQTELDGEVFEWSIIEQNTDIDMFSFTTLAGDISFEINPFQGRPNLDVLAELYDSNGVLIASSNPIDDVNAIINANVAGGEYYLSITGTGRDGRYSDYGSLGFYSVEGFIIAVPEPSSVMLLGGLGLGMLLRRRKR